MPGHVTTAEKLAAFLWRLTSFEKQANLKDVRLSNYQAVQIVEQLRGTPNFEVWVELAKHQMTAFGLGSVFAAPKGRGRGKSP